MGAASPLQAASLGAGEPPAIGKGGDKMVFLQRNTIGRKKSEPESF